MNLFTGHGALSVSQMCCIAFEMQLFESEVQTHSSVCQYEIPDKVAECSACAVAFGGLR